MDLSRRDLLVEERDKKSFNKEKADKAITTGGALQAMMETYGWKLLMEEFIKPNIEESRWLGASKEDLSDIRAEVRVLKGMLKFIETRVKTAEEMVEKIKK